MIKLSYFCGLGKLIHNSILPEVSHLMLSFVLRDFWNPEVVTDTLSFSWNPA